MEDSSISMTLYEDFDGTPYKEYARALFNYADGRLLYDDFKQTFPQNENSRCLAMTIWIYMLNNTMYPSTTYSDIAHILSKGKFAVDRAKISKGSCREQVNCKQNHPIFQLNSEETLKFVSLLNDKPKMNVDSNTTCNHLRWDIIVKRNNLGLADLQRLHGKCNFDITKCQELTYVWKTTERSLMDCEKEFKENPTQILLTKIESLRAAFIWTVKQEIKVSDLVIQIPDADLFQRVSGLSMNYNEADLRLLLIEAEYEMCSKKHRFTLDESFNLSKPALLTTLQDINLTLTEICHFWLN